MNDLKKTTADLLKSNYNLQNRIIKARATAIIELRADLMQQLVTLRKECPHTETFEGQYSWRPGASYLAEICCACGDNLGQVGGHTK